MESDAANLYTCEPPLFFHRKAEFRSFSSSLLDPENLCLGNSLWSNRFGFISKLVLSNTCQGQLLEPVSIYLCIHPSSLDGASKGSEVGGFNSKANDNGDAHVENDQGLEVDADSSFELFRDSEELADEDDYDYDEYVIAGIDNDGVSKMIVDVSYFFCH
ncbi:hypothetical protein RHGRI_013935 [Rhododendron griersonianum]|uniref:Uncharacterized protein n=1 Tax=Rhododendron griersonianum TaxID=479676 RepID=A0AAV6K7R9_9ERIC|nr:hypothetical protein RHGRI_013935 [Rhododendron griersonianum]